MKRALGLALVLAIALAGPVAAQIADAADAAPTQVLTLDLERLFEETEYGQRVARDIEAQATALAAENRRIEAELTEEERSLTERRASVSVEEFRALADAFDAKVDAIRDEQDAKTRDVQRRSEVERQRFFGQIGPVLSTLVRDRNAAVVLDRRSVFIAAETADITDEAIARVNTAIGDGTPQDD